MASTHEPLERKIPRKVVVVGARGGAGATMVACHLGAFLARRFQVCLLDLDVAGGDVAATLDLRKESSLTVLLERWRDADEALVHGAVGRHPSGLRALPQPWNPAELPHPSKEDVVGLMALLARHFEMLVVDAGVALSVPAITACEQADEVLVILKPHVVDLRALQRLRGVLRDLGLPVDRLRVVLNEAGQRGSLKKEEIEDLTGLVVDATLPSDPLAVGRADRAGDLLYEVSPRSALSRALAGLWSVLRDEGKSPDASTSPWRWLNRD